MKKTISIFIMLLSIVFYSNLLWAQERKNNFTVSGVFTYNTSVEDQEYNWERQHGYQRNPSPGIELVFRRTLIKGFEFGTGINYQLGFASSYINNYERRFKFNDISVPVLLKKGFKIKDNDHWYSTTGFYIGKTTNVKVEYPTSGPWQPWPNYSTIENYSDDIVYSDIYFDFGYHTSLQKIGVFSISPFIKYRFNTTWLNYHQNKIHFGIKINYSLNF